MDLRRGHGGSEHHRKFFASLAEDLARHVSETVRYETPDDEGETRRQRNARFGVESPDIAPVEGGAFFLDAFWQLDRFRGEGLSGPEPITPQAVRAWQEVTGSIVRRDEYAVLFRMDAAYRSALAKERQDQDTRKKDGKRKD